MAVSRRTGRSRLTLALLVLTSLAVLTLDFRDAGVVEGAREIAATIFSPFRGVARAVSSPFSNGWNGITDYGDVKSENEELRRQLDELRGEAVENATAQQELSELLSQMGIEWYGAIPTQEARVSAGAPSNFSHTIEIDQGSDQGIKLDMPVVNGAGLVGKVVLVTGGSATVQLITDPDFAVGVRLVETGDRGTARGAGPGEDLVVDTELGSEEVVDEGAVLVTSGARRSNFPASVPVGTVRSTERGGGGLTLDLHVEPMADTERLNYVTVLLWEGAE